MWEIWEVVTNDYGQVIEMTNIWGWVQEDDDEAALRHAEKLFLGRRDDEDDETFRRRAEKMFPGVHLAVSNVPIIDYSYPVMA